MYISDVNRKTQEKLTKFCERNDLSFEIWENPNEPCVATFFIHDNERLMLNVTKEVLTIYCLYENIKSDWVFVDTRDYYQMTW